MKPSEIADWLEGVKKDAGDSYDRVRLEMRRIADLPDDVSLVAYFPDGRICSLVIPVKG
jgi:hypothetical protein